MRFLGEDKRGKKKMLDTMFQRFIENSPVSVMARSLLEYALSPNKLDHWFDKNADYQYTKDLLFSSVFDLMRKVVFTTHPNIHVAFQAQTSISVTVQSIYNKLNAIRVTTSAELVRHFAQEMKTILEQLQVQSTPLLDGFRLKIVDGNAIAATEHRLKPLRKLAAGALPGKSLVVYDPNLDLVIDVFPCEDGHAQERSLFHQILPTVQAKDLWIEDRNFCTIGYIFGIIKRGASLIVRQHLNLPLEEMTDWKYVGKTETGMVYEQKVKVKSEEEGELELRRIKVILNQETRDKEKEIYLITNLSEKIANGKKIAELYRKRWTIETAFQKLEKNFNSEINTLGYPKAALFGFCVALIGYNVMAVIKGALKSVYGVEKIEKEVSEYYIAEEIGGTMRGMMIAIPEKKWKVFSKFTAAKLITLLKKLAKKARLASFKKHTRGVKKKRPKKYWNPKHPHVSTAKILLKSTL